MNMLGFVYLVLILGWILIVLFLKCKKSITPHISLNENYTDALGSEQRRPSVHVIQLQAEALEHEDHTLNRYSWRQHSPRIPLPTVERGIDAMHPNEAVTNHAFTYDEEYVINAPPPSYDDVMRQPDIYPKVHSKYSQDNK